MDKFTLPFYCSLQPELPHNYLVVCQRPDISPRFLPTAPSANNISTFSNPVNCPQNSSLVPLSLTSLRSLGAWVISSRLSSLRSAILNRNMPDFEIYQVLKKRRQFQERDTQPSPRFLRDVIELSEQDPAWALCGRISNLLTLPFEVFKNPIGHSPYL